MANYQNKYTFTSNDKLHTDYCNPWPEEWKNKQIDSFDKKKKLLGNCCDSSFYSANIMKIDLKKYGFKFSGKVSVHKNLEAHVTSIFAELSKIKTYEIRSVGGYLFRYKKNNTVTNNVRDSADYQKAKDWYCQKWNKKESEKDSWWNEHWSEGAAEYDLKNGSVKESYLSNHSFGSAIDINPTENGMNATTWDMPPEIVKIFLKHGFYWGGFYNSSKDAMHFEYMLDEISGVSAPEIQSKAEAGSFKFPLDLGGGIDVTKDTIALYYDKTEKDAQSGYFPVGLNTVWHGGVHIYGKEKDVVHACLDGKIIGARLGDQEATAEGHYGSRNFLLLEHMHEKQKFYCLYMHLYSKPLTDNEIDSMGIKWTKPAADKKIYYTVANGKSVSYRSAPGVKSNPNSKELGSAKAGERLDKLGIEKDPGGDTWVKVMLANGTTAYIYEGAVNRGDLTEHEEAQQSGPSTVLEQLKCGNIASLDISVKAGDSLWGMGQYGSSGSRVALLHWEVFSESNLLLELKDGIALEDQDDDYNMECNDILNLFKKYQNTGWWEDDEILEQDELKRFFTSAPERLQLRNYACKFVSEWGIKDLDAAIDTLKGRWITYGLKDRMKPYLWWPEAVSAGVKIPSSAYMWHFNPTTVLLHCSTPQTAQSSSAPQTAPAGTSNQTTGAATATELPQSEGHVYTNWTKGFNRSISEQNKFNEEIYNATKDRGINPYILKSLIAQESGFKPEARNNGGYAGLTQIGGAAITTAGLNIGNTKKVDKKWEFDLKGDERFIPEKSIEGGAKVLLAKMKSVDKLVFKNYTVPLSELEKYKFYLAAYNGGEGTVQKAYNASGITNATWDDIIKGKENSPLWGSIPESWGREGKYKEISTYPTEIIARATQESSGSSTSPASSGSASPKPSSSAANKPPVVPSTINASDLKKGYFDDVALGNYTSKSVNQEGYVKGNKVEQLQKDLIAVGITSIGSADGDFGSKTEQGVKQFQQCALQKGRETDSSCLEVPVTFKGGVNGVADKATMDELSLWLLHGYKIPGSASGQPAPAPSSPSNSTEDDSEFIFPLAARPSLSYKTGKRYFGADRDGGRKHAGCDLIASKGTPIYAIADGEVVQPAYDFYEGTDALEVKHGSYVVRYGEILPGSTSGLKKGSKVTKGQLIAKVGLLNSGSSMLHFEMYSGSGSGGLTDKSKPPYMRRNDVMDPAPILDNMKLKQ
jgi:murein DD-endopeptidase MepM/ murein hydrolase activator NlpD